VAGVAVTYPSDQVDAAERARLVAAVNRTATSLSNRLGARGRAGGVGG
jgi:hypothetical protein